MSSINSMVPFSRCFIFATATSGTVGVRLTWLSRLISIEASQRWLPSEPQKKQTSYFPWNHGWLIGILTLAYYNPYKNGYYNPLHPNKQGPFFHCSSNVWRWLPSASTVASSKSWCRTGWWKNHAKVVLPGYDPEKLSQQKWWVVNSKS